MTLNRTLKLATNKTYDGYDWTEDGRFEKPRVKGINKRRRSKYQRTIEREELRKERKYDENERV